MPSESKANWSEVNVKGIEPVLNQDGGHVNGMVNESGSGEEMHATGRRVQLHVA